MTRMTMIEAIQNAHDVAMDRDEKVVVFGEDVGFFGGVFRCTAGLQAKYGNNRCFDTPISELGIVGTAIGMAAYGLKPVVEIQFADYVYPAYDQIVSEAAAYAIDPVAISLALWLSECRQVAVFLEGKPIVKAQKHCSPM